MGYCLKEWDWVLMHRKAACKRHYCVVTVVKEQICLVTKGVGTLLWGLCGVNGRPSPSWTKLVIGFSMGPDSISLASMPDPQCMLIWALTNPPSFIPATLLLQRPLSPSSADFFPCLFNPIVHYQGKQDNHRPLLSGSGYGIRERSCESRKIIESKIWFKIG